MVSGGMMNEPGSKVVAAGVGRVALRSAIAVLGVAVVLLFPQALAVVAGLALVFFFLRFDRLH